MSGNYKIHFVLTDTYTNHNAPNGLDHWHHDMVDMAPSSSGMDFSIAANTTDTFSARFQWKSRYDPQNLTIISFIQNDDDKEVVQTVSLVFSIDYFTMMEASDTNVLTLPGGAAEIPFTISNYGGLSDTYDVAVSTGIPAGWSVSYTLPDGEHTGNATLTLDANASYAGILTVSTDESHGIASMVELSMTSQNSPSITSTKSFYVINSTDILILNSDPGGGYLDYFTSAIDNFNATGTYDSLSYMLWNEAVEQKLNTSHLEVSGVDLVFWCTGDSGILEDDQYTGIATYIESGGNFAASGDDAVSAMRGKGLTGILGIYYLSKIGLPESVIGMSEDPISDGLTFTLTGGTGANNCVDATVMLTRGESAIAMIYPDSTVAAVRSEMENYRTLVLGFPFEAIADEADRNLLMARMIEYLMYVRLDVPGHDVGREIPLEFALHGNSPNPFNPVTEIRFDLYKSQHVRLTVFNLLGQEITRLVDRPMSSGAHSVVFNGGNLASGVYIYAITTPEKTVMKKMVLLK